MKKIFFLLLFLCSIKWCLPITFTKPNGTIITFTVDQPVILQNGDNKLVLQPAQVEQLNSTLINTSIAPLYLPGPFAKSELYNKPASVTTPVRQDGNPLSYIPIPTDLDLGAMSKLLDCLDKDPEQLKDFLLSMDAQVVQRIMKVMYRSDIKNELLIDALQDFYQSEIQSQPASTKCNVPIIEVNDPKNLWSALEPYTRGDKPTLVVTDIDGTLGRCSDPRLDETIYNINISIHHILIPQSQHLSSYLSVFDDHIKFMKETEMKPLDEENSVKTAIENLQARHIPIIGATSRSVNYDDITLTHLHNLKIYLEKSNFFEVPEDFQYPYSNPPCSFKNNTLFCQGGNKAERLLTLLKELKLADTAIRIIVLEDKKDNLIAMYNIFHEQAVLIYLNVPHSESDEFPNKTLIQQSLARALANQSTFKAETREKLKDLKVNFMPLTNAIFSLPYPKNVPVTEKTINSLAPTTSLSNQLDAEAKRRIRIELLTLLKSTKDNIPTFYFIDKASLGIFFKQQAACTNWCLLPLKFLYPRNERLLRRITNQLDLLPNQSLPRNLSLPLFASCTTTTQQTSNDFNLPLKQQSHKRKLFGFLTK